MGDEQCALGARNRADIENLQERVRNMENQLRETEKLMQETQRSATTARLGLWQAVLVAILAGACGIIGQLIAVHAEILAR